MFVRPRCISDAGNSSFATAISGIRYFVSRFLDKPTPPPSIFHGSTPFVRSQNSRSRLLPQRIEFFRTTLSFSLSLPSGIQSRRGDRRRGERWNVSVGSKVKGETRVRGDGGRIRWSDVKANFHEPGRKCTQADAQSGRKSYKAYLTTDPLIFNFRPAKWSGFGELASACRRLVSMEIQLGKLFQPRRYRSHHRSPRGEKYRLRAYQPEIDFSLFEEERFVAGWGGGGGTARVMRMRLGRSSKVRDGRGLSLIFKFAFVDRAHVSVSLRNFIPLARGISGG